MNGGSAADAGDEEDQCGSADGEQQGQPGRVVGVCPGQNVGRADVEQESGEETQIKQQVCVGNVEQQGGCGAGSGVAASKSSSRQVRLEVLPLSSINATVFSPSEKSCAITATATASPTVVET